MTDTVVTRADQGAYQEAITEIGKGIALGLLPFLGQAIDIYDTIESLIAVHQAKEDDQDAAKLDLMLAIIGWIPGPGDGVKKSLRLVNRNPDRFSPVLFDVLRFVMNECGIKGSPEALLDEVLNVGKLKAGMSEIRGAILASSTYLALPEVAQKTLRITLETAEAGIPPMVGIVERRILNFKKKQANSTHSASISGKAKTGVPESHDPNIAKQGEHRDTKGNTGDKISDVVSTVPLSELTSTHMGVAGEHIADYYCLETFGWGKGEWDGHDKGDGGIWKVEPSHARVGKLSNHKKLYKLSIKPNPQGIDSVWHASGHNGSKSYAIVEAKSSVNEDAPKFIKENALIKKFKPNNGADKIGDNSDNKANKAHKIKAKLKAEMIASVKNAAADLDPTLLTHPEKLLEPLEDAGNGGGGHVNPATQTRTGRRQTKVTGSKSSTSKPVNTEPHGDEPSVLVQMSHEWILKNIPKAVSNDLLILKEFDKGGNKVYSRHLFYSPNYTNFTQDTGNPKIDNPRQHAKAMQKLINKQPLQDTEHAKHECYHYNDDEVKAAVNKRKASLRKVFGSIASLKEET